MELASTSRWNEIAPDGTLKPAVGLSPSDSLVRHAVGLFETMAVVQGTVAFLSQHLERLYRSACELGLGVPEYDLGQRCRDFVRQATVPSASLMRLRLTLTGGGNGVSPVNRATPGAASQCLDSSSLGARSSTRSNLAGSNLARTGPGKIFLELSEVEYSPEHSALGVELASAPYCLPVQDPLNGHKSINYWSRLLARQRVLADESPRAFDILFLDSLGHIACGAITNIFACFGRELWTPASPRENPEHRPPVLPGITRQWLLDQADDLSLVGNHRPRQPHELQDASEVFLCNSLIGVVPVRRWTSMKWSIGPNVRELQARWQNTVVGLP